MTRGGDSDVYEHGGGWAGATSVQSADDDDPVIIWRQRDVISCHDIGKIHRPNAHAARARCASGDCASDLGHVPYKRRVGHEERRWRRSSVVPRLALLSEKNARSVTDVPSTIVSNQLDSES